MFAFSVLPYSTSDTHFFNGDVMEGIVLNIYQEYAKFSNISTVIDIILHIEENSVITL